MQQVFHHLAQFSAVIVVGEHAIVEALSPKTRIVLRDEYLFHEFTQLDESLFS